VGYWLFAMTTTMTSLPKYNNPARCLALAAACALCCMVLITGSGNEADGVAKESIVPTVRSSPRSVAKMHQAMKKLHKLQAKELAAKKQIRRRQAREEAIALQLQHTRLRSGPAMGMHSHEAQEPPAIALSASPTTTVTETKASRRAPKAAVADSPSPTIPFSKFPNGAPHKAQIHPPQGQVLAQGERQAELHVKQRLQTRAEEAQGHAKRGAAYLAKVHEQGYKQQQRRQEKMQAQKLHLQGAYTNPKKWEALDSELNLVDRIAEHGQMELKRINDRAAAFEQQAAAWEHPLRKWNLKVNTDARDQAITMQDSAAELDSDIRQDGADIKLQHAARVVDAEASALAKTLHVANQDATDGSDDSWAGDDMKGLHRDLARQDEEQRLTKQLVLDKERREGYQGPPPHKTQQQHARPKQTADLQPDEAAALACESLCTTGDNEKGCLTCKQEAIFAEAAKRLRQQQKVKAEAKALQAKVRQHSISSDPHAQQQQQQQANGQYQYDGEGYDGDGYDDMASDYDDYDDYDSVGHYDSHSHHHPSKMGGVRTDSHFSAPPVAKLSSQSTVIAKPVPTRRQPPKVNTQATPDATARSSSAASASPQEMPSDEKFYKIGRKTFRQRVVRRTHGEKAKKSTLRAFNQKTRELSELKNKKKIAGVAAPA